MHRVWIVCRCGSTPDKRFYEHGRQIPLCWDKGQPSGGGSQQPWRAVALTICLLSRKHRLTMHTKSLKVR